MLKILQNISQNKKANFEEWKEKYKNVSLGGWGFNELDSWVTKIDEGEKKRKVKEALEVFKAHKND